VLLAAWTEKPEKLKVRKLFIVARDDANDDGPRLPKIRANYERASDPKELIILNGSGYAQFLFQTDQGERVMREIVRSCPRREEPRGFPFGAAANFVLPHVFLIACPNAIRFPSGAGTSSSRCP
jgi:hypothetical protein